MSGVARLDPAFLPIVAAMPGLTRAQIDASDPAELVRDFRRPPALSPPHPEITEQDLSIETRHGPVRVRIYRPVGAASLPLLLSLHGGGWVGGSIEQDDARCRLLAARTPCVVVSVDYGLAPENRFPVALEQAEDIVERLRGQGALPGCDAARFALCGSSSGGAITAALAQRLARRGTPPQVQVLTYPVCDSTGDYGSWREFAEGHLLSAAMMEWFWSTYAPDPAQRLDGDAAPMRASDISGAVPTLVVTAEFDILRDEAEAYAARLAEAGANVTCSRYAGMIHGFISVEPTHPESISALEECSRFLRTAFGSSVDDRTLQSEKGGIS